MKKNGLEKKTLAKQVGQNKKAIIVALIFALIGVIFIIRSFAANNPDLNGDLNGDDKVTIADLSILLSSYNKASTEADVNGDGQVNATDLPLLLANFGKTAGTTPTPPAPNPTTPTPPAAGGGSTTAAVCGSAPVVALSGYTEKGCENFNNGLGAFNPYNGGGEGTVSGRGRISSQCTTKDGYLVAAQASDGATCGGSLGSSQSSKTGYWEYRMKVQTTGTSGTPTHPVLLLWPDAEGWPQYGEIDYFETNNGEKATGWLHCIGATSQNDTNCYRIPDNDVDYSQWHVYSLLWTDDRMTGYIDGQQWWSVGREQNVFPNGPFHATVQHDCIGCGLPIEAAEMHVDYGRMFTK